MLYIKLYSGFPIALSIKNDKKVNALIKKKKKKDDIGYMTSELT